MSDHVCLLTDRPCRCDLKAEAAKLRPCALSRKLGVLLRLIDSDKPGEADGGPIMFINEIKRDGIFRRIAALIETFEERKYTDSDAKAILATGIERGLARGRRECGGRVLSADFFDENGEPRWLEIVHYCEKNPNGVLLGPKERDMINEMPSKLQRWHAPTRAGGGFLLSIFWKCRGSFL
jgi:hypothetical protein